MTYTLLEARTALRSRLDESAATASKAWSDTDLNVWINDTVADIARRSMCHEARSTLTVVSGTSTVTAPTNTIRISMIVQYEPDVATDTDPRKIEFIDQRTAARHQYSSLGTGRPRAFSTWGAPPNMSIQLYPTPDAAGQLVVSYFRHITRALADATVLDLPNGWDDLIIDGAEFMALRRDRDQRWQEAKSLYEQKIEDAIESMAQWVEASGQVQTMFGTFPDWLTSEW